METGSREKLVYQNSDEHLNNLKKAREKAKEKTQQCVLCNEFFSRAGFKAHVKKCSNGKNCPVCERWFSSKGTTCSHSCANKYFRSGTNHGAWKESSYRTTCFFYHKKKCVVCGEENIVEVHHYDEDKTNNSPANLVPLCPTHHQYWHSNHKYLVEKTIEEYVEDYKGKEPHLS